MTSHQDPIDDYDEYGGMTTSQDTYNHYSSSIMISTTPTTTEPTISSTFKSTRDLYPSSQSRMIAGNGDSSGSYGLGTGPGSGYLHHSSNESSPEAGDVYISAPIKHHTVVSSSHSSSVIDTLRSEYNSAAATSSSSSYSYVYPSESRKLKPVLESHNDKESISAATSTVDLKSMLAQRDLELHTLQQNYEIQYQESAILKQKLLETVTAYEDVCKSQDAVVNVQAQVESDKQREEITFLRSEYEKAQVLLKELDAEKVLYKEMLEQYQHRESNASALQQVTSNQIDQLDAILQQHKCELASKQELINKTVREYSTVMSNYESKTEYCVRLETERNTLHKGIEKMKHDLAELFNEKTMAHEEFSRMKNMVEAESRKNAHLDNELENTRQKLYRVEEQLTVNLKHTNSLTLELISTRKELILANNSVTSLQKYLGENDPHINVYNPKPIPVDEDRFTFDGDHMAVADSGACSEISSVVDSALTTKDLDSSRFLSSSDRYLLESLSAARDTIASLEVANKELLDALAAKQHDVTRLRNEGMEHESQQIKEMEARFKSVEDAKKEATKALGEASLEKQSLLDKIRELEESNSRIKDSAKEDAEEHEVSLKELKATLEKLKGDKKDLVQELQDADQLEKQMKEGQRKEAEKIIELEGKNHSLQTANELIANELSDGKQALDVAETRIKGLEELLAASEKKLEDAALDQKKLNDDLYRANLQKEFNDKSFADTQDEIATLEQELQKSREEFFGAQFQLQQTNKDLADANNKCDRLKNLLADKDATIGNMKQELVDMGHKRDMIDKDLLHLKDSQLALNQKKQECETELEAVKEKMKRSQDTVDDLKSELAKKEDDFQKLTAESGNNAAIIRQLEKDIETKDREVKDKDSDALERESDLQLQKKHLADLREALDETREILAKRDNQVSESQKSIEKLLKQNEDLMLSSIKSTSDYSYVGSEFESFSSIATDDKGKESELGYFSK